MLYRWPQEGGHGISSHPSTSFAAGVGALPNPAVLLPWQIGHIAASEAGLM